MFYSSCCVSYIVLFGLSVIILQCRDLVSVSNSTVKNIFENGMIPKLIQQTAHQCGIYNLGQLSRLYVLIPFSKNIFDSISRFPLRDKVALRLLKLYFCIADMVEWSRALDIRQSDWCCSVSMV